MTDQTAAAGADTPYSAITIQGLEFQVAQPYKAGNHALTAGEASALNQTRAENIRNNFASTIKKAIEEFRTTNKLAEDAEVPVTSLDHDDLSEKLATYDGEYEFGVRGGPSGPRAPVDPVGREAFRIASERVKLALKKKGIKLDSVPKEKMAEFVTGAIAKYPEITAEAKRRVEATAGIALDSLQV